MVRTRRRQLYHSKKSFSSSQGKKKRRAFKGRRTKDSGSWEAPLPDKTRRTITIADKLQVVQFWNDWKTKKSDAVEAYHAPLPPKASRAERRQARENRKEAKKILRVNIQRKCMKDFPSIVGRTQVCKWVKVAEVECWKELPEAVRARASCTTNKWRRKLGLPDRGRPVGGQIPYALQRELDILIGEHAVGLSCVSERKEIVGAEAVEPRFRVVQLSVTVRTKDISEEIGGF